MTKKIIELEEGTERIMMYEYASVDDKAIDYPNGDRDVLVENLPDAPKRPTIELPLYLIEELESERANATDVYDFLSNIPLSEIGISLDVDVKYSRIGETSNFVAMWYLGYADLVPNKEPKYFIPVTPDSSREYGFVDVDIQGNVIVNYFDNLREATMGKFSEEEADRIVKGLSALNARKVKVEEG